MVIRHKEASDLKMKNTVYGLSPCAVIKIILLFYKWGIANSKWRSLVSVVLVVY